MKTILVLTGGSETDKAVFVTALAAARPLGAHLEFLHIRVSPDQAAAYTPHVDFAMGAGLHEALSRLRAEGEARSRAAARHFQEFCEQREIDISDTPSHIGAVSAAWREECDDAVERMMRHARHNDLVVLGRSTQANGLPSDFTERLLIGCGRPLLIAPQRTRQSITGTVLVCWKETAEAAHALGAAIPLLRKSKRVVIVGVEEPAAGSLDGIHDLAHQLTWHGISAECRWMPGDGGSVAEHLEAAAAYYDVDFLVMGGYGHGRVRETLFGGCTQRFLDYAEWPVFIMR